MNQTSSISVRSPLTSRCGTRTLALTTSNTTVTLPAGGYELVLVGDTTLAVIGFDTTTAALPSTTEAAGVGVFPPGAVDLVLEASTVLNARVLTNTATLYIVRKAVS